MTSWREDKFLRLENLQVLNKQKSVGNNNRFVFNITNHPVLAKLKSLLSEINLLLTRDREHGKVFERIPVVRFRRAKSLKDIFVRAKVAPLEKKKVLADHVEVLVAKYASMLLLLKLLDLLILKENIALSLIT